MASQSTSKQLVNYGATVVGGVAMSAAVGGIQKGIAAYNAATLTNAATNDALSRFGAPGMLVDAPVNAGAAAVDAAKTSFTDTLTSTFTNPAFLSSVGLGVAGILLGSGSKKPSLVLPNIVATAGVALSVGALLKQGQASLSAMATAEASKRSAGQILAGSTKPISAVNDPGLFTARQRSFGQQFNVSYPRDLGDQYFIKLSIQKYQRVTSDMASMPGNPHTVIKLPIPANLVDAIQLAYQSVTLGMFGGPVLDSMAKGYNAYKGATGSEAYKIGRFAGETASSMKDMLKDDNIKYAIFRRLLGSTGTLGSAADLITGTTPNPHMAITFQGVNMKEYTYTWRLSPTDEGESSDVRQIIRNLQAAALPNASDRGLMLSFPDIVTVELDPPELMMFRPCVIDNVTVNYTPNGMPAFFAPNASGTQTGHPVEVELTIKLREVDIHTNNMKFYNETRSDQLTSSFGGADATGGLGALDNNV